LGNIIDNNAFLRQNLFNSSNLAGFYNWVNRSPHSYFDH